MPQSFVSSAQIRLEPDDTFSMSEGEKMTFVDGDKRSISLKEIIDHVKPDAIGAMKESLVTAREYKVIETIYTGNAVEELEKELNELGKLGWRVSLHTNVREARKIDNKIAVDPPTPVLVLEREES